MLSRHLRHHAVAYLGLVVALSTGTSYAEVKNGGLTAQDLSAGSVGTDEIRDGTFRAQDLAAGAVPRVTVTPVGTPDPG